MFHPVATSTGRQLSPVDEIRVGTLCSAITARAITVLPDPGRRDQYGMLMLGDGVDGRLLHRGQSAPRSAQSSTPSRNGRTPLSFWA